MYVPTDIERTSVGLAHTCPIRVEWRTNECVRLGLVGLSITAKSLGLIQPNWVASAAL